MSSKKIYITFDYELFFGPSSGSIEKSIIEPTNRLGEIARRHKVAFTFFVDAGMLCAMKKFAASVPGLERQYDRIVEQLRSLKRDGHSLQLHIHPHWEDTAFSNDGWAVNVSRYRLDQFSDGEILRIVTEYKNALEAAVGPGIRAFRAGGWCIQPFHRIKQALQQNGILIDSTLYQDGYMNTATHRFDFRGMPRTSCWKFENDPMVPDAEGCFTEIPISVTRYSRWFYLSMAFHRLSKTPDYRFLGDGAAIGAGRWNTLKLILMGGDGVVSLDGFRARRMNSSFRKLLRSNEQGNFVVIGHPKALCNHSFVCLDALAGAHASNFAVM